MIKIKKIWKYLNMSQIYQRERRVNNFHREYFQALNNRVDKFQIKIRKIN